LCSWRTVKRKVESGHPVSSEKTLCFLFAMELYKRVGNALIIDFENRCYDQLEGSSKYLDLLIYTDQNYKVAIEFKLPQKSSSGNSNQTQTREAIYRDIARLHWLKSNSINASACFFMMLTNEDAYLNNTGIKEFPDFLTKQNYTLSSTNNLNVTRLPLSGVSFTFHWLGVKKVNNKYKKTKLYSWLKPIKL
jgi:hypothetical protein